MDRLLERPALRALQSSHGRQATLSAARAALDAWRTTGAASGSPFEPEAFDKTVDAALERESRAALRPVINLTGTVLHTNLGRAVMAPEAIEAVTAVMRGYSNLEFNLGRGARGDRDDHIEGLLREFTGAEAATAVNNNAAAVMLVLSALAEKKEVPVSRGELVEIGGAFRIPDIMRRAGCKLVEVGTTNRTHLRDFEEVLGPKTGMVMKVHTSNYQVQGFTAAVPPAELAALCHSRGVPFSEDLGAGTLVDLTRWGLPHEPTPAESVANGVDVVTFSGDKLLGGPQAGLIVGRKDLIARIKKCPLKRSLRLDKMTIAALEATLRLYRDPDRLSQRLPALRLLTRPHAEIKAQAARLQPAVQQAFGNNALVSVMDCRSQIGSGSLPVDRLESAGLSIASPTGGKRAGAFPERMAKLLRERPVPIIGRIEEGELRLDLRCLDGAETEQRFLEQLTGLMQEPAR